MSAAIFERSTVGAEFLVAEADRIARLCRAMSECFARGGRLVAFGSSDAERSDVRHVAVEFVHPVIVGKRALPAIGVRPRDVELLVEPLDIAMGFGAAADTTDAIERCNALGALTIAFDAVGAEWELSPPERDPFARQEVVETAYHLLWELVHVFLEHTGMRTAHDAGASSFLYPFLGGRETDIERLLADVARSVVRKSMEVARLRGQTLADGRQKLEAAARALRSSFEAGGRLLALGNGGSATDAMDVVADFRDPPHGWPARPAIDLTEDPAVLTAIANDVGVEALFSRQVIAHGRPGDALLALSTSGNSANVIAALAEARRREIATVAMVGYDGGRVEAEGLADHVVVTRSQHIPRIQEAQASAYHVLRGLVEEA